MILTELSKAFTTIMLFVIIPIVSALTAFATFSVTTDYVTNVAEYHATEGRHSGYLLSSTAMPANWKCMVFVDSSFRGDKYYANLNCDSNMTAAHVSNWEARAEHGYSNPFIKNVGESIMLVIACFVMVAVLGSPIGIALAFVLSGFKFQMRNNPDGSMSSFAKWVVRINGTIWLAGIFLGLIYSFQTFVRDPTITSINGKQAIIFRADVDDATSRVRITPLNHANWINLPSIRERTDIDFKEMRQLQ